MTMIKYWHFSINVYDDHSISHKGMHGLYMTMAALSDVHQIVYAMSGLQNCFVIKRCMIDDDL